MSKVCEEIFEENQKSSRLRKEKIGANLYTCVLRRECEEGTES
jgi:hypothetical protein